MLKTLIRTGTCLGLCAAVLALQAGTGLAENITLKMWSLTNPDYPEYIEERKQAFKKLYPNVDIVLESTPNEAYKTAIQVALVGSEPPDVFFNWSGEDAARLAREGLALDISELGKQEGGFRNMLSDSWQASFMVDGKNYGIPTDAITKYFYYNKDFFAQNQLSPPETFGQLLDLCQAIRKVDDRIVPMPLGNSERWKLNHFITLLDERVMGIDGTAADYALTAPDDQLFTDPGYVTAWQKVLDLQHVGRQFILTVRRQLPLRGGNSLSSSIFRQQLAEKDDELSRKRGTDSHGCIVETGAFPERSGAASRGYGGHGSISSQAPIGGRIGW